MPQCDRCTQTGKKSSHHWSCSHKIQDVVASCHGLSWALKPGSSILNPNPSSCCWNGTMQHSQGEGIQENDRSRNETSVTVWISCVQEQLWTVNVVFHTRTSELLCSACSARKKSEVLLLHDSAKPLISVHTTEAITEFGQRVLPYLPKCLGLVPSVFHLFGLLKDTFIRIPLQGWWGTTDCCIWVAAEEGEKLLLGIGMHAFVLKSEKSVDRNGDYTGNSSAFRKVVTKFSEIFTCLICKYRAIKNKKHYFWLTYICILHWSIVTFGL